MAVEACLHCQLILAANEWIAEHGEGVEGDRVVMVTQYCRALADLIVQASNPGQDRANLANHAQLTLAGLVSKRLNEPIEEEPAVAPAGVAKH
ncbi:hypothetical protein [Mesorhizobium sp. M2A.F.Ca.ET.039.01.1.1]|uniref:hypothetical protein n=1 Tax=Mesorhizobium sp. M2A.F.Ca.ET.039.01.1.1 TaxID=2496746 RepID=UPI000FC99604|nr:hypothetical protein [Mesorhizobium sp. M2A.F.Ca.ET.039.01.1.1]RWX72524.1 hypothetical protein EOA24_00595 [Mesorhizobium sp. M2A.F.Ca.ET.039.01.1.1]